MLVRFAVAAVLAVVVGPLPPSHAFQGFVPFASWSTSPSVSALKTQDVLLVAENVLSVVAPLLKQCPKAVVLFDQPGLQVEDYASLPEQSAFKRLAERAKATVTADYIRGGVDINRIVLFLKEQCDAEVVTMEPSEIEGFGLEPRERPLAIVVRAGAEPLSRLDEAAKKLLASVESIVADDYSAILTASEAGSLHLAGLEPSLREGTRPHLVRRAVSNSPGTPTVTSNGGLFAIFTILTPGVWMGFFAMSILVPILLSGVILLSSIQTPTRFEKKAKNIK